MKINQGTFIQNFVIEEGLIKCNVNVILIKTNSSIKMIQSDNYKELELCPYHYFTSKLIYLIYDIRLDIVFIVGQLSKYNSDV